MKSNSYLIFALLFLLSMLDQILVSLDSDIFLLDILISLSFVLINLILIQLASELINHKLFLSSRVWITYGILTFFGLFILKYLLLEDMIPDEYFTIKFLIGEPLRIIAGVALIHGISRSKLIIKSRRTTFVKNGWIFTGIILVFSGIIQFIVYSLDLFYVIGIDGKSSPIGTGIAETLSFVSVVFLSLFASLIAIFYPEAMLLSQTQIIKASKLYNLFLDAEKTKDEIVLQSILGTEAPDALIDYIKNLPNDVVDVLKKPKSFQIENNNEPH